MMLSFVVVSFMIFCLTVCVWQIRSRSLDRWLVPYIFGVRKRGTPRSEDKVCLIFCISDHYEPQWAQASAEVARERVEHWVQEYPRRFGGFRDSDGRPPRHTFFYPLEEYVPEHMRLLAELCRLGFGEIEVQLHHDGDTADRLREKLVSYKELLARSYGLLSTRRETGELVYGFVHGNWALDNSRPDGCWCGVNNELDVLRETGCYADFTLPSAPSPTQTRKINSLYYARDDPQRPKSHDTGIDVGAAPAPPDALMLLQGPLLLDWRRRKWGIMPHIENGCIQEGQPPTRERLDLWLKARIQVPSRPDWYFVKLHAHGATESTQRILLGEPMVNFHRELAQRSKENPNFSFHYVTAREMYNLARAAEAGWQGSVESARDFELIGMGSPRTERAEPNVARLRGESAIW